MKFNLEVTTTQRCDMACSYCFEGEELQNNKRQDNTDQIIQRVHDMLNDETFMSQYSGIILEFWGGEPTLNFKMIKRLIFEFKDCPVDFFSYTNGLNTLNIEGIILYAKQYIDLNRISFQISYDGLYNDKERVDHQGKGTSERVLSTLRYLKNKYPVQISLKATMMVNDLQNMIDQWHHFKSIQDEFHDLVWAPTLEYTQTYQITDDFIQKIRKQFLLVTKLEIEHYSKYKRNVLSWYNASTTQKAICSAGLNIANIDLDGNLSVCHGALYSPDKKDLVHSNIYNADFLKQLISMQNLHKELLHVPESCESCVATVCYQCPTVQYSVSNKSTYNEKYHDPKSDLCRVYQTFGEIHRTYKKYIKEQYGTT